MPSPVSGSTVTWRPITDPRIDAAGAEEIRLRLVAILRSWRRTPYSQGARMRGPQGGVDCVRFVSAVLDELYGFERAHVDLLPQDGAMHDRRGAFRTMRALRRMYAPNRIVTDWTIEPGDVVVTGDLGAGPGHGMIVGAERNHVWEATSSGVHRTGVGILRAVHRVYRQGDRHLWLR